MPCGNLRSTRIRPNVESVSLTKSGKAGGKIIRGEKRGVPPVNIGGIFPTVVSGQGPAEEVDAWLRRQETPVKVHVGLRSPIRFLGKRNRWAIKCVPENKNNDMWPKEKSKQKLTTRFLRKNATHGAGGYGIVHRLSRRRSHTCARRILEWQAKREISV